MNVIGNPFASNRSWRERRLDVQRDITPHDEAGAPVAELTRPYSNWLVDQWIVKIHGANVERRSADDDRGESKKSGSGGEGGGSTRSGGSSGGGRN